MIWRGGIRIRRGGMRSEMRQLDDEARGLPVSEEVVRYPPVLQGFG